MSLAIKVENLSKAYQLGEIGTGTISRDLERWWASVRGKEDPFLKIGETNDRTKKSDSNIVWSLKDLNFEIEQGDAVGIIGRNGAGKSTLLKILSRVTAPTQGTVKIKGRVASLLEVGTGFNPELTGRENIFLNGAFLGMRKAEIRKHFDAIVDFAGVERYIDTPVKRYSSGMYVRLAFAVAAHLEAEILVVDEVLAVGDAEFQKKCLGKMNDVSKGEGRTVLFVSHNMASIKQLCTKGILLDNGEIVVSGSVNTALQNYQNQQNKNTTSDLKENLKAVSGNIEISKVLINNSAANKVTITTKKENLSIRVEGKAKESIKGNLEISIFSIENILVGFYSPGHFESDIKTIPVGDFVIEQEIVLPDHLMNGEYYFNLSFSNPNIESYFTINEIGLYIESFFSQTGRLFSYNDVGFIRLERNAK